MINKELKSPPTKRHFATVWGELDYLCQKIRYWLYVRKKKFRAERFLGRLERVLGELPDNDVAILRQEGSALFHELKGEIGESIACRSREIELMEQLHAESHSPRYDASTRAYMLRDRDVVAMNERRAILKALQKQKPRQLDYLSGDTPGRRQRSRKPLSV